MRPPSEKNRTNNENKIEKGPRVSEMEYPEGNRHRWKGVERGGSSTQQLGGGDMPKRTTECLGKGWQTIFSRRGRVKKLGKKRTGNKPLLLANSRKVYHQRGPEKGEWLGRQRVLDAG